MGITATVALMALHEWRKIRQNRKKEKVAFVILTALGWLLAILLVFFPDIPGPTQMIDTIYKPLGKLLEK